MIENISEEIKRLIEAKARQLVDEDLNYKETYNYLESELLHIIDSAKEFKSSMDENNLTFNSIESEGYLRCAITIEELIKWVLTGL